MQTNGPRIELDKVCFSYPTSGRGVGLRDLLMPKQQLHVATPVLKSLSLTLEGGHRFALVGANGCGKSTLCSLVAGILRPKTGTLHCHGMVRAYLHGHAKLYDNLSIELYLKTFLHLLWPQESGARLQEVQEDIVEVCQLRGRLRHSIHSLSAGMLAKLHLCAYSAFPNSILLIDEGLSSLEFSFHELLKKRMDKSLGQQGILIMVEHQRHLLEHYCTKTLLLKGGQGSIYPLQEGLDLVYAATS